MNKPLIVGVVLGVMVLISGGVYLLWPEPEPEPEPEAEAEVHSAQADAHLSVEARLAQQERTIQVLRNQLRRAGMAPEA